jgi:hypothetical protein
MKLLHPGPRFRMKWIVSQVEDHREQICGQPLPSSSHPAYIHQSKRGFESESHGCTASVNVMLAADQNTADSRAQANVPAELRVSGTIFNAMTLVGDLRNGNNHIHTDKNDICSLIIMLGTNISGGRKRSTKVTKRSTKVHAG